MKESNIEAVIFDLDGVITNTATYHFLAWKFIANQLGISINESFNEQLKGISRKDSLERILEKENLQNKFSQQEKEKLAALKNEKYCEYLDNLSPNNILPNIKELIKAIRDEKILIGLASVSKNATRILDTLKLTKYFDHCVDPTKINKSKPDPEIFIKACQELHCIPSRCIGIEDSKAGIDSIVSAGIFSVGIGKELRKANYRVNTTNELYWDDIRKNYFLWKTV